MLADIDECRFAPRKCTGDHEICVNRYGGYSCQCRDQFKRNTQTKRCERKFIDDISLFCLVMTIDNEDGKDKRESSLMSLAPTSLLELSGRASEPSNRKVLGSTPDRIFFFRVCLCHSLNNTSFSITISFTPFAHHYQEINFH